MDAKFEVNGDMNVLQDIMINQKNGIKYENGGIDTSDCYVVDLENFSNGVDKEHSTIHQSTTNTNSRITLQRSFSRKVPQRCTEKEGNERDVALSSSPRASQAVSALEKFHPPPIQMGSQEHTIKNHQQLSQHQITIKTGGMTNTIADGKLGRRSSFKRSSNTWFSDPKRILLLFATMSSMGTMLLIYLTISVSKANDRDDVLDWQ